MLYPDQGLPSPPPPEVFTPAGVVAELRGAVPVQREQGTRAAEIVRDGVVAAIPKRDKVDLGQREFPLTGRPEARIAVGGQDAVGAVFIDGGGVQCLMAAADGCSFGGRRESARAARATVETALGLAPIIAWDHNLSMEVLQDRLANILVASHGTIIEKHIGGATTAVVGAISREVGYRGKGPQIYLHVVYCGDPQVVIMSTDREGKPKIRRIISPADQLDRTLRAKLESQGQDLDSLAVNIARIEREGVIQEYMRTFNLTYQEAEDMLTQSGIYAFLGYEFTNRPVVRGFRVNLSRDRLAQGETKLIVGVCSDNVGDKVPEDVIAEIYTSSRSNRDLCLNLNQVMARRNEDDGCLAVASVGGVLLPGR